MTGRQVKLEVLQVAEPCREDWGKMRGDDQVRFCGVCAKHVYNLSAMGRGEAERMVAANEGRMCVRFYRREDGTVVTADCSLVRRAARKTRRMLAMAAAGIVALVAGVTGVRMGRAETPLVIPDNSSPVEVKGQKAVMGDVALPEQGKMEMGKPVQPVAPVPPVMGGITCPPAGVPASQPATQPGK